MNNIIKKCILEGVGTFLLTIAVIFTSNPLCIGFMLTTLMIIGYHISGAHYNPAVSIAHYMKWRITIYELSLFALVQTLGAFMALLLFKMITGTSFTLDVSPVAWWIAMGFEALLTALLCLVIITIIECMTYESVGVHVHPKKHGSHLAMLTGFCYTSISIIGGLFNPAIGCASVIHNFMIGNNVDVVSMLLIRIVGPLLGGAFGSLVHQFLNERSE